MFALSESTRFKCLLLISVLVIASNHLVESHNLPQLNDLLEETGLGQQKGAVNEQETKLIEQISALYEDNETLHDQEESLLKKVGTSKPDAHQKNALLSMYNLHLINRAQLGKLSEQLKNEVQLAVASENEVAPAA